MNAQTLAFDGFQWDQGNEEKIQRRLPLKWVEALFRSPVLVKKDLRNSNSEPRFFAIGRILQIDRPIFVVFTIREEKGRRLIRPISARVLSRRERRVYENEIKKINEA